MLALSVAGASEVSQRIDDLQWKARIVLMFSSGDGDGPGASLETAIRESTCDIKQRDIVLGRINPETQGYLGEYGVNPTESIRVRERYGVAPSEFRVLLIGKDGGVKATFSEVPALQQLFDVVDAMPMRRREVRNQLIDCAEKRLLPQRPNRHL